MLVILSATLHNTNATLETLYGYKADSEPEKEMATFFANLIDIKEAAVIG